MPINVDATTILNVLTAALAGATVWLAFATHRMATATRELAVLEGRPYLRFSRLLFRLYLPKPGSESETKLKFVQIGVCFTNPGRVTTKLKLKTMRVTCRGSTADKPSFHTKSGEITPGDEFIYWYEAFNLPGIPEPPIQGVVEFEVEYSGGKRQQVETLARKLQYTVTSIEPYSCDWVYLEEPDD